MRPLPGAVPGGDGACEQLYPVGAHSRGAGSRHLHELMASALAPLKGNVLQATSDEAPGLLAYGTAPWRAPLAGPSMCSRNCTAIAAPMAAKQRAAHQAVTQAEETLNRVQERLDTTNGQPAKRGPGRPQRRP